MIHYSKFHELTQYHQHPNQTNGHSAIIYGSQWENKYQESFLLLISLERPQKAKELGIPIITEQELLELLWKVSSADQSQGVEDIEGYEKSRYNRY